ncbi:MAG: methyltransferase domain-containing protein [Ruminococcaceae bacterium]|nr:methyltransferase domain-containing protein [Oscillospiraceae bacterium]
MWWTELLRCPVCGAGIEKKENSLLCVGARRHCFDFAAQGYVNVAGAKAAGGGDDATLIAARTAFLSAGHYSPFAARICALLDAYAGGRCVLDAGCGEGYYTNTVARAGYRVIGVDLSKRGVRAGAKAAQREGLDTLFAVAGIYTLPVLDGVLDAVVSLFAPIAEAEFLRVLKPGGILITAGAGRAHLFDLKRVLYDTPRENEARADLPTTMHALHTETLDFTMQLQKGALADLFAMTPYYYRTSREGAARLEALNALDVGAQMDIHVYQKQG